MKNTVKGLLISCLLGFGTNLYAVECAPADSITSNTFCSSFKNATQCHCYNSGLRGSICTNMVQFYIRMINTLGTLQRVCSLQHYTSTKECIDDWNCYRYGGLTSDGQLCGGNAQPCEPN